MFCTIPVLNLVFHLLHVSTIKNNTRLGIKNTKFIDIAVGGMLKLFLFSSLLKRRTVQCPNGLDHQRAENINMVVFIEVNFFGSPVLRLHFQIFKYLRNFSINLNYYFETLVWPYSKLNLIPCSTLNY